MNKVVRNTSLYTIGNILPKISSFVLLPLYTKYLSTSEYGIVNSLNVLSSILVIVFTFSISRSIYRLYHDYKDETEKQRFIGTINLAVFIIASIMLGILFVLQDYVTLIYESIDFWPYFAIVILTSYFSIFETIPKIVFQVKEKAAKYIILSLLQFLFTNLFIVYLVVYKGGGAKGFLLASLYGNLIILPALLYYSYKQSILVMDTKMLKAALFFSLPMIPANIAAWVINLSDRMFIERYFDLSDVGVYSLGYKIAGLILIFSNAFSQAYNPYFYKIANNDPVEKAKPKLQKANSLFSLVIVLGSFSIAFLSKEIVTLIFPATYHEAYKIIPLICLAYIISQVSGVFNLMFYQLKATKAIMYIVIFSAAFNILLNWLLIPRLGIYGAAYATVLSFAIGYLLKYYFAAKQYFIPFNNISLALQIVIGGVLIYLFDYQLNIALFASLTLKTLILLVILSMLTFKKLDEFKSIFSKKKNVI